MIGLNAVSHFVSRGLTEVWLSTKRMVMTDELALATIRQQAESLSSLSDQALRQRVDGLRQSWPAGNNPPLPIITESFSLLCESIGRTHGLTLYDAPASPWRVTRSPRCRRGKERHWRPRCRR